MNKPKFPNKRLVLVASVILCLGLIAGALIAQALTPSTTFWISPGVYPGAPSYTVWVEGSNYFAKDAFGHIIYDGTSASAILQDVCDVLPDEGGNVFLSKGEYTFNYSIMVTTHLFLYGEYGNTIIHEGLTSGYLFSFGTYGTQSTFKDLYMIGEGTKHFFNITRWGITLYHVYLDNVLVGVHLGTGGYTTLVERSVFAMNTNGIGILGDDGADTNFVQIIRSEFVPYWDSFDSSATYYNTTGIQLGGGYQIAIERNDISLLTCGIRIRGGNGIEIRDTYGETPNENTATLIDVTGDYSLVRNIEVNGITWNGKLNSATNQTYCLQFNNSELVQIANIHILSGGYHGVRLLATSNYVILANIYGYDLNTLIYLGANCNCTDIYAPIMGSSVTTLIGNFTNGYGTYHGSQFGV